MRTAVIAALAVALAGTTMGASSCDTSTTSKPDQPGSSGGDGPSKSPQAHLGDSITLKGTDTKMKVTVTRVIDPVHVGEFDQPSKGRRFIGIQIKLRNVGSKTYKDSPSNGAKLITTGDQQADTALITSGDCSSTFGSDATISPGSQQQGCIGFEVKKGAQPKRFQFGLDSGFGPQTGEWSVR
jgi:hypothetical protein